MPEWKSIPKYSIIIILIFMIIKTISAMELTENSETTCNGNTCQTNLYSYQKYYNNDTGMAFLNESFDTRNCGNYAFCVDKNQWQFKISNANLMGNYSVGRNSFIIGLNQFLNNQLFNTNNLNIEGSTATYKNILPNVDLQYQYLPYKLKEYIIVNRQPNINNDVPLRMKLDRDYLYVEDAGGISIIENNTEISRINNLNIYDNRSDFIGYFPFILSEQGNNVYINALITRSNFTNPSIQYPLFIDPTVITNLSVAVDLFVSWDLSAIPPTYTRTGSPLSPSARLNIGYDHNCVFPEICNTFIRRSTIDWNVPDNAVPDNAIIKGLILDLNVAGLGTNNNGNITITHMGGNSTDYADDGSRYYFDEVGNGTNYTVMTDLTGTSHVFNLTNATADFQARLGNNSFSIGIVAKREFQGPNPNQQRAYSSSETASAKLRPVLNVTYFIDNQNPVVRLIFPANNTFLVNANTTAITANISDDNFIMNTTLHVWNRTQGLVNTTALSFDSTNWTLPNVTVTLPNGNYTWNYLAIDEAGKQQWNNTNWTFNIYNPVPDLQNPRVNLITPLNNTMSNIRNVFFNASFIDNNQLQNGTLYIWNSTLFLNTTSFQITSGATNSTWFNMTLPDGNYTWNYLIYDFANNSAWNNTNWTVNVYVPIPDLTPPSVNLISPLNNTLSNIFSILFNGTFTDNNQLQNGTLYIWNKTTNLPVSLTNFSLPSATINSTWINVTLPNGNYTWNYLIYDFANNSAWNNTNWTVNIFVPIPDTSPPNIFLINPQNNTMSNIRNVLFNASFVDDRGLQNGTLYIWNSTLFLNTTSFQFPKLVITNSTWFNMTLPDGNYTWNFQAYDTYNNSAFNATNWTINVYVPIIDIIPPVVNLISPANNTITNNLDVTFQGSFTDNNQLLNGTLHIWNTTQFLINTTSFLLTGISALQNILISLPNYSNYTWNYLIYDTAGNSAWNNTNWTVIISPAISAEENTWEIAVIIGILAPLYYLSKFIL